jgi:hypothetical protein
MLSELPKSKRFYENWGTDLFPKIKQSQGLRLNQQE